MFGRSRLLAAALMAGVGSGINLLPPILREPRVRRPALATAPSDMRYGMTKRSGGTVAQAKRAAVKARNRARNKAAHKGA